MSGERPSSISLCGQDKGFRASRGIGDDRRSQGATDGETGELGSLEWNQVRRGTGGGLIRGSEKPSVGVWKGELGAPRTRDSLSLETKVTLVAVERDRR